MLLAEICRRYGCLLPEIRTFCMKKQTKQRFLPKSYNVWKHLMFSFFADWAFKSSLSIRNLTWIEVNQILFGTIIGPRFIEFSSSSAGDMEALIASRSCWSSILFCTCDIVSVIREPKYDSIISVIAKWELLARYLQILLDYTVLDSTNQSSESAFDPCLTVQLHSEYLSAILHCWFLLFPPIACSWKQ